MIGHNGYKAIVPGTEYAAVEVRASWAGHDGIEPGAWVATEVEHIGDDPLWEFLPETGEDGPDNRAINHIHRADFRRLVATTREYGPHIREPLEAADRAMDRIRLRRAMRDIDGWGSITLRNGTMGVVRLGDGPHHEI